MRAILSILVSMFLPVLCLSQDMNEMYSRFEKAINQEDCESVITLGNQLLLMMEQTVGVANDDLAYTYLNLGYCYTENNEFSKSNVCLLKAEPTYKDTPIYHDLLWMIAKNYYELHDYNKAAEYYKTDLEELERTGRTNSLEYYVSKASLAQMLSINGSALEAIALYPSVLNGYRSIVGESSPLYIGGVGLLAGLYAFVGNHIESIRLYDMQLELLDKVSGRESKEYANALASQAANYFGMGDYQEAINLFQKSFGISKGQNYPLSLTVLALCYCEVGNYDEALRYITESIERKGEAYGKNSLTYAVSLQSLAYIYYWTERYSNALQLYFQSLDILSKINDHDANISALKAGTLVSVSSCEKLMGNNDKAIKTLLEASKMLGEAKEDHQVNDTRIKIANNLGWCYYENGDFKKSLLFHKTAFEASLRIESRKNHIADILFTLAFDYMAISDYITAYNYFIRGAELHIGELQQQLSKMSSQHRTLFWNKRNFMIKTVFPNLAMAYHSQQLVCNLYDKSCLFSKGLLLSVETEMRKLILESGDETAVAKFEQLQATRVWLNKLYEKPIAERYVSTDSLENVAERLETELVQMSRTYGDFMHNLKLTWKDVQAKLGDKDVAVEFLSFPILRTDSIQYVALTVRKGYDAPHMVKLFEESELRNIKSSYYKSAELSKLVWGKMTDELEGVENIYFSPSGELYNIAIESMPHWADSCMMSDRFNLYRLSSTRELAINRSEIKSSGAVIYGGIQYDTDVASMGTPKTDGEFVFAYRGFNADSTNYRGTSWQFLSGTMVEAENVDSILAASKTDVTMLSGNYATEVTFKNLSGQKKNLIHIATHGFYWNESAAERKKEIEKLHFLQLGDDRPRYVEDKAMTRSGLLFAGANNTFKGVEIPTGVDDGVLTAQEIAQLDLRGLDLLVLSACQTGLGEIKGDGVFGLQRGFKKAGVQTIMMSLWEVSDEATKDLMTQFYTALTSGKTKRDAFNQAQQYVKDHDADYSYRPSNMRNKRPHWAAFILLD